jgi:hypothetical protein
MQVRTLELRLKAFGAAPTAASVELGVLTRSERLKKAGLILGAGFIAALIALPIPLVHFVFVPGALAAGLVLAALRFRQEKIFRSASGACPYCGAQQRFPLMGPFKLPKTLHCEACQRQLSLEGSTIS